MVFIFIIATAFAASFLAGCSDTAGATTATSSPSSPGATTTGGADSGAFDSGAELRVAIPSTGRAYVKLAPAGQVPAPSEAAQDLGWDLAFEGGDVFTNGGVSGAGQAAAFGPLDAATFLADVAPQVPFLTEDKAGGAFLDWYAYEGSTHALFSRFHVYGVKDGDRLWKVQVLGYYGERDGAAVAALYTLRYAELTAGAVSPTRELALLDGTADGTNGSATAPSECVDLGSGARTMLNAEEARASRAWHLCFRRASISVNGETGGPRGVTAVDLQADATAAEDIDSIKTKTADGARAAFDAVAASSFAGKTFRGDRVVSGFTDGWATSRAAWLVRDASGVQQLLVAFTSYAPPTATAAGSVVLRIKPVKSL